MAAAMKKIYLYDKRRIGENPLLCQDIMIMANCNVNRTFCLPRDKHAIEKTAWINTRIIICTTIQPGLLCKIHEEMIALL